MYFSSGTSRVFLCISRPLSKLTALMSWLQAWNLRELSPIPHEQGGKTQEGCCGAGRVRKNGLHQSIPQQEQAILIRFPVL
jgi:hypothetical protein